MLQTISQLSEAETRKVKGTRYGGEAQHDDEDDEDDDTKKAAKKQEPAAKRGRGRPKKGADSETGQVAKYDNAKNLQSFMVGNVPKKSKELEKLPKKKHSLKEWVEEVEAKYLAEGSAASGYSPEMHEKIKNASPKELSAMATEFAGPGSYVNYDYELKSLQKAQAELRGVSENAPGQSLTVKPMPGAAQLVDPATQKVMATGDAAAVKNIQGAVAQGKVQMRGEEMAESDEDYSAKKARAGKDIGKPGKQFSKIAKGAAKRYGSAESGKKVAGAVLAKLRSKTNEADIPSDQNDMGAGLGAGRSGNMLEGKKPDFLDLDKDKNKKESMEKAAQDAKKKKKVKEGMEHHLQAARLEGKSHALRKMPYNCTHDDMEEARMYHDGFKEGLDECYGQSGMGGMMEAGMAPAAPGVPPATTGGMASAAAPTAGPAMDEGNAFTGALARTPKGSRFTVGGKSFTDRSNYDSKTFESLDSQLNALLESEEVSEGMSVSISKGQQGSPDSVSVTAQDGEADQLLSLIKSAGLGLFGGDENNGYGVPQNSGITHAHDGIEVVDDHDGMMSLIKKVTGAGDEGQDSQDYADEEGHSHEEAGEEEACNECGMAYESCGCDHEGQEVVDEFLDNKVTVSGTGGTSSSSSKNDNTNTATGGTASATGGSSSANSNSLSGAESNSTVDEEESYDQEEYEVAEDNAPDSDSAETTSDENAEAAEDQALATADAGQDKEEGEEDAAEDQVEESLANGADDTFEADINFMTKVISGGLNKPKSTGQTTIPVIAGQGQRMVAHESINDWKKLAGI